MSNYPFDTFPLTKRIGIVNPVANLDARYGPWPTFNDALTGFSSLIRERGLTVAVLSSTGVIEYWYKDGITDNNLVLKQTQAGAGLPGATGASGLPGGTGATGASGLPGGTGATGASGIQGLQGATGASGLPGSTGATGASGLQGLQGATGASGLLGGTGATGASGLQGLQGATGASGLPGATGASGIQGLIGSTGATGAISPIDSALSTTSSNAVMNSAIAIRFNTLEQNLSSLADPPTYVQPQAILESFTNYEVGETVSQVLDVGWTQGSAGSLIAGNVTRNGIVVLTYSTLPQTYTANETASATAVTYRNTVAYNQGPILNNSLGYPDPVGRIAAGSTFVERGLTGLFRVFFGSYATLPTNTTQIRNLTGNKFDTGISPAEFGPLYANNIIFALPQPKVLTNVITQANENITSSFTLTPTSIPLPNGALKGYNYYTLTTTIPLNIPLQTISYA
jgi:hypothetical protein